jgi:hypothetical protein
MAFNPEAAIKGLDKRVNSMEKILDSQEKQARQAEYSTITKKLEALEKKQAEISKTQDALAKKAANLEKISVALATSLKDPKKFLDKARGDLVDKEQSAKIADAVAKKEGEKIAKDAQAQTDKVLKEIKDMKLDARLNVIEARLASLGR